MNIQGLWKYDNLIKAYEQEVKHNVALEKENDELLEELYEHKEKIREMQDLIDKYQKTKYIWDPERREWLPASGTISEIQRKVPFPLVAHVSEDKK